MGYIIAGVIVLSLVALLALQKDRIIGKKKPKVKKDSALQKFAAKRTGSTLLEENQEISNERVEPKKVEKKKKSKKKSKVLSLDEEVERLPEGYTAFKDVLGVDYVIVSVNGLFIVLDRDWDGLVFGKPDYSNWVLEPKGQPREVLGNPMSELQELAGIVLSEFEDYAGRNAVAFVSFNNNAAFKFDKYPGVVYRNELIESILDEDESIYSEEELDEMIRILRRD